MRHFFEIQHSDGQYIQRIAVLSRLEIELLRKRGYHVVKCSLSTRLYPWLLGKEDS